MNDYSYDVNACPPTRYAILARICAVGASGVGLYALVVGDLCQNLSAKLVRRFLPARHSHLSLVCDQLVARCPLVLPAVSNWRHRLPLVACRELPHVACGWCRVLTGKVVLRRLSRCGDGGALVLQTRCPVGDQRDFSNPLLRRSHHVTPISAANLKKIVLSLLILNRLSSILRAESSGTTLTRGTRRQPCRRRHSQSRS